MGRPPSLVRLHVKQQQVDSLTRGLKMGTNVVREHLFRYIVNTTHFSECTRCNNSIHAPTQRVGDADCRMLCSALHAEYCGNQNRVAIYQFSASGVAPSPDACLQTNLGKCTLTAQFRNPPTTGPATVPVVVVEMAKNDLWTILSVRSLCLLNLSVIDISYQAYPTCFFI